MSRRSRGYVRRNIEMVIDVRSGKVLLAYIAGAWYREPSASSVKRLRAYVNKHGKRYRISHNAKESNWQGFTTTSIFCYEKQAK